MLMQCIDSLVQKVQSGVVINFEKIGADPPPIDGATAKEGEEEVNHEPDKEVDADADRNGVSLYLYLLITVLAKALLSRFKR